MAAACAIPRPILVEMKARRRAYRARVAALLAVVVAALLSRTALAAQSVSESAPLGAPVPAAPAGGAGDLLRLAGALAVVVGLAFGIQWWLRRSGLASQWRGGAFEVLARHPVGRGQAVLVARFGTRVLLVQQSRDGLRTLAEVSDLLGVLGVTEILQHLEPVVDGLTVLLLDRGKERAAVAGGWRHCLS